MVEETKTAEQTELGAIDEGGEFKPYEAGNTEEKPAEGSQPESGEAGETTAEVENTGEKPAKNVGETKEVSIEGLTDAQIDQLIRRLTKDGGPYHKNPAFQRIIRQRDGFKEKNTSYLKRYAEKDPQGALEMLLDEGYGEREARGMLADMGINPNLQRGQERGAETGQGKENFEDNVEFLKLIANKGYDINSMTPEQRQFWQFTYSFVKDAVGSDIKAMKEFMNNSKKAEQDRQFQESQKNFLQEFDGLKKQVKDEYAIEWNEDNDRIMEEYLKEHPKFRGGMEELFYLSHRDKLVEMGKVAANKETAEINESKRLMNSEKPGSTGKETLPPGIGPGGSMANTFRYLQGKYGK